MIALPCYRIASVLISFWVVSHSLWLSTVTHKAVGLFSHSWGFGLQAPGRVHSPVGLACRASRGQTSSETLWFCLGPWGAQFPSITSWRIPYLGHIGLTAWEALTGRKDLRTRLSFSQQAASQWWMLKARVTSTDTTTHNNTHTGAHHTVIWQTKLIIIRLHKSYNHTKNKSKNKKHKHYTYACTALAWAVTWIPCLYQFLNWSKDVVPKDVSIWQWFGSSFQICAAL